MVFKFPENNEQDFIKRVIALPGDTLEALDGRPVINGWRRPALLRRHLQAHLGRRLAVAARGRAIRRVPRRRSVSHALRPRHEPERLRASAQLQRRQRVRAGLACRGRPLRRSPGPLPGQPPAKSWVMGDNRNNSHDSRSWRGGKGGGVPFEYIKGRALFIWMSFGPRGSPGIASASPSWESPRFRPTRWPSCSPPSTSASKTTPRSARPHRPAQRP